ncbi:MAG: carbonic anhydrase [Chloroflexaceae bacterium]|nr:carbonic anhydrase [Chloroflexaceae bacterium]
MPTTMSADAALEALMEGNKRFVSGAMNHPHQSVKRRLEVAQGQDPFAIILCCADSRIGPEVIFDQGLGDIFVIRVAGNVAADPTIIAGIEFASAVVGAPLLVVLGHQYCGAIQVAVAGGEQPSTHLNQLMTALEPAITRIKDQPGDTVDLAITANVHHTVELLHSCQPIIADLVQKGALKIVGGRYSLDTGEVELIA